MQAAMPLMKRKFRLITFLKFMCHLCKLSFHLLLRFAKNIISNAYCNDTITLRLSYTCYCKHTVTPMLTYSYAL